MVKTLDRSAAQLLDILSQVKKDAYQDGYAKGWHDAVAKIVETASAGSPPLHIDEPEPPAKPPESQYKTPIIRMVHQIIKEAPGHIGANIIREVMNRDPSIPPKVADRTGRTSLSRLRRRGLIYQRGKKWFPAEQEERASTEN